MLDFEITDEVVNGTGVDAYNKYFSKNGKLFMHRGNMIYTLYDYNHYKNEIYYTVYPLSNTDTKDFYYEFSSFYNKIVDRQEKFNDDYFEDFGEIYDEFYIYDIDDNEIVISPQFNDCISITIKNKKKLIDVDAFDNLIMKCCMEFDKFKEFNEVQFFGGLGGKFFRI